MAVFFRNSSVAVASDSTYTASKSRRRGEALLISNPGLRTVRCPGAEQLDHFLILEEHGVMERRGIHCIRARHVDPPVPQQNPRHFETPALRGTV